MCDDTCRTPSPPTKHFIVEPDNGDPPRRWQVREERESLATITQDKSYDELCEANREAKRRARSTPDGALVTTYSYWNKTKRKPLFLVSVHQKRRILQEAILSNWITVAAFAIIVLLFIACWHSGWYPFERRGEICCALIDMLSNKTELVVLPAGLLLTLAGAITGIIAVDHKTPWNLRRTIIVRGVNLSVFALVTLVLAFVYLLVPHNIIRFVVGPFTIGLLAWVIWGMWQLFVYLYFFGINAAIGCNKVQSSGDAASSQ